MTHREALKLVHGSTNRMQRKVANNTYARIEQNGDVVFRLHSTDIVTIHPDNTATVKTGGWHSHTTKARINKYLPSGSYLYQQNWKWFLSDIQNCEGRPFEEGMLVVGT